LLRDGDEIQNPKSSGVKDIESVGLFDGKQVWLALQNKMTKLCLAYIVKKIPFLFSFFF
jgi:hypothetical protein